MYIHSQSNHWLSTTGHSCLYLWRSDDNCRGESNGLAQGQLDVPSTRGKVHNQVVELA